MEETNTLTRDQLLKLVQKLAASNDANKELITQESQKIVNASGDGKSKSDKRGNPNSKKSRFDMSKYVGCPVLRHPLPMLKSLSFISPSNS